METRAEKNRNRSREYMRKYHRETRLKAIEVLGGECILCGFSDPRALQIDHINGGGSKEASSIGNPAIQRKVASGLTEGYQLLCANCNWIKRAERGETNEGYRKGG